MRTVAIVGASLAGLSAAPALREQSYEGAIVIIRAEPHLPYDRPPLSKDFLTGDCTAGDLALTDGTDDSLELDWRLGHEAVRLDPTARTLTLADGAEAGASSG